MESLVTPVLRCEDVLKLINKRSFFPSRCCISVKAHISSMSEILRMKHDDFFLLELGHGVFLLVKDFHLDWHWNLTPLTTVVFHDLRLTTIEKGVSEPRPILIAWKTSRITVEPESKAVTCIDLEEWLSTIPLTIPLTEPLVAETNCGCRKRLHHFKGTVSDVSQSDDGIFFLDAATRLFTGFIPLGHFGTRDIKVGNVLHIFNVHQIQDKGVILVACSHSLIRSHNLYEKSQDPSCQYETHPKQKTSSTATIGFYIQKYGLNFSEAVALLALKQQIRESKSKNIPRILTNILKSEACGKTQKTCHSAIDLFIKHDRLCQVNDDEMIRSRIPCLLTVQQLKSLHLGKRNGVGQKPDGKPSWSYYHQEWKDAEVLLGTLDVSKHGNLEFSDKTGKIPVVLFQDCCDREEDCKIQSSSSLKGNGESLLGRDNMRKHSCDSKCLSALSPLEEPSCSLLSQDIIGRTLLINKYHLVCEFLKTQGNNNRELASNPSEYWTVETESDEVEKLRDDSTLPYLLISILDCILLEKAQDSILPYSTRENENEYHLSHSSHSEQFSSCLIHVSSKESIVASSSNEDRFRITGTLIKMDALNSEAILTESNCSGKFGSVKNGDGGDFYQSTYSRKRSDNIENYEGLNRCTGDKRLRSESQTCLASDVTSTNQREDGATENSPLFSFEKQPVKLFISGLAIASYPFFNINKIYMLSLPVKSGGFRPVFSSHKVGQTLFRSNSSVFIDVKDKLVVQKAVIKNYVIDDDRKIDKSRFLTVKDVIQEREATLIVSFRGVIIAREALTSTFPPRGVNSGGCTMDDIKLVVADLDESNANVHVYFKSFKAFNLMGLIPGSVVDFCLLERKVSQQGNIYCKFGVASSFYLHNYIGNSQQIQGNAKLSKEVNIDHLPREYLLNVWHIESKNSNMIQAVWQIHCHVCMIFKLSLKVVCSQCQGVYLRNGCQSRDCKNLDSYRMKAYATILVDDGTSQASVKIFSEKLVQKLLTLTEEQWSDLISTLLDCGEILVTKFQPSSSHCLPIERFLYQLVQSPLVTRACSMAVRRMRDSPNSATVAKMNLEDFKTRDVNIGQTKIPVLQLPLLQLECLDLKETSR